MNSTFLCGAATRDITPTVEMGVLPMPKGFSATPRELTCVHDPINLRVIALKANDTTVLLLSMDVVNINAEIFGPALSEHTGVPLEAVYLLETAAHSTIRAGAEARNSNDPEGLRKMEIYVNYIMQQMFDAADSALLNMKPAKVGIGYSQSYVNINRYPFAWAMEDGNIFRYAERGLNPEGPSDHTVIALRFEDMNGEPIAFLISYGIFNVLMHDNICGGNGTGAVSADLAGYVSTHVEQHFPGTTAMWVSAAGCDQNPLFSAHMSYPDPDNDKNGEFWLSPEGCSQILTYLGQINYADTLRAIVNAGDCNEANNLSFARGEVTLPGRKQEFEEREGSRFLWSHYSEGPDKTMHMSVLRIGEIALVFHGGAIFSTIGQYLKQESILKDTVIVTGFVNPKVPFDGVVCDDETFSIGGHDPEKAKYRPGFVKNALALLMNQLIMQTENKPYSAQTAAKLTNVFRRPEKKAEQWKLTAL